MKGSLAFLAVLALTGCVLALPTYNPPTQEQLVIRANKSGALAVHIAIENGATFSASASGHVVVEVPVLPRSCSTIFLGLITVSDGRPENQKVFEVLHNGRVVKKLSLKQLQALPTIEPGYHLLSINVG